jgi:isoquinoline 1-oxidoreductase subunit beta
MDFKIDGMLNAAIRDCPYWGGSLKSFDASAAEKMPGVKKIVRIDKNAVAVIADTWWRAKTALEAVKFDYDPGPQGNARHGRDINAMLDEGLTAKEAFVGNQGGDVEKAIAGAARKIEATTRSPTSTTPPWSR